MAIAQLVRLSQIYIYPDGRREILQTVVILFRVTIAATACKGEGLSGLY